MSAIYIDPNIYTTSPNPKGRLEKELKVYELLDLLKIPFTRIDHDETASIESCIEVEEQV